MFRKPQLLVALAGILQLASAVANAADHRDAPLIIIGADTEALGVGMYLDCRSAKAGDIPLEQVSLSYEVIARSAKDPSVVRVYPVSLKTGEFESFDVDFADFGFGSVPIFFDLSRTKTFSAEDPESGSSRACFLTFFARQYAKSTGITRGWPVKWEGPGLNADDEGAKLRQGPAGDGTFLLEGSALEGVQLGFRARCPASATDDGASITPDEEDRRLRFTVLASDPTGYVTPHIREFDLPDGGYGQFDLNFVDFEIGDPKRVPVRFIIIAEDVEGSACRLTMAGRAFAAGTQETTHVQFELKNVLVSSYNVSGASSDP